MSINYQTGDQSSTDLKEKLKQDLGNKAREASRQFADKGKEKAEALSSKAADALEDVEAVAEAQAEQLDRQGWTTLSEYIREMADGIGDLSENLRHKSVDELVHSATELARRNTGLFLLGSVAIGFGLSRFVKAAAPGMGTGGTGEGQRARQSGGNEASADSAAGGPAYAYPAGEGQSAAESSSGNAYPPFETH